MQIEIDNLGPIKKGNIDLSKKLTVFTGPNNSGKTYAAFLIYALTKSSLAVHRNEEFEKEFENLIKNKSIIHTLDEKKILSYRKNHLNLIKNGLDGIFGISDEAANTLFEGFSIKILETEKDLYNNIFNSKFEMNFMLDNNIIDFFKDEKTLDVRISIKNENLNKRDLRFLDIIIFSRLYSFFALKPFTSSHILPVERNSIYTFSKELSIQKQDFFETAKEITNNNSKSTRSLEWYFKRTTRYPQPIRDGLEVAEDLYNFSKRTSKYYELAEQIEQELLLGKVSVNKDGDVQFSSNRNKRKKIPIQLSASIVKTLSSLVFYLKHLANENDLIIIDEPELNLHPNNQIFITRLFAKLINNGFRLLINTHSDYIIREFNNLIMLSHPEVRKSNLFSDLGYTENEFLNKNDINSYLFNYKNKASRDVTIQKIEITDEGFDVETIDNTVDALNKVSEDLFYTIKYPVIENNE
ncbi:AAA family ATPase [Chryseobacterium joostei]|uniref:AAA family ATPase n=1 Tax=Chryseobacterium joostei TaxID=112234 RepID=UPI003D139D84